MKRLVFLVGLVVLVFGVAILAQQKGSAERELIKLELDWANALAKMDLAFLDQIMADDCVYTDTDGVVWTKAQMMANWKSGEDKISSFVSDNIKVRVYGDAAVALCHNISKEIFRGKDLGGEFQGTDTWIKKAGRWVCVATHQSKIAGK